MSTIKRLYNFATVVLLTFAVTVIAPTTAAALPSGSNPTPVFRFYKYHDGAHFFTNNESEKATVETRPDVYRYEGIAYYSYQTQVSGSTPVYRFYNFINGVHFYTNNQSEYANVLATAQNTYRYEGIAYYSLPSLVSNSVAVHRFYNFRQGVHFYTTNQAEATQLNNTAYDTYRYEGIAYYLPNQLSFSGTGNQVTESFILPTTLAQFNLNYTSSSSSNFIVTLYEANTGDYVDLLANEITSSTSMSVPWGASENRYIMQVQSSGPWSITVDQPKGSSGYISSFSGTGTKATQLFTMSKGPKTLSYSHDGTSNFIVTLWDENGNWVDLPVNEIGTTFGGALINPDGGNYMMGVQADGNWAISIN